MNYDHDKNLTEARLREERRQFVICAVAFTIYAAVVFTMAYRVRSGLEGKLLAVLGGVFLVGAVWFAAQAVWIDQEDER